MIDEKLIEELEKIGKEFAAVVNEVIYTEVDSYDRE